MRLPTPYPLRLLLDSDNLYTFVPSNSIYQDPATTDEVNFFRHVLISIQVSAMSKGNMLLGHARGKVGDLVFSRSNGQQVVRARAAVVKNPQTQAQMISRIILNTIAQAYSRMSTITDHSFEGIQPGQKSMSFFMTKNLNELRAKVTEAVNNGDDLGTIFSFTPINENMLVPNEYLISQGSLPQVPAQVDNIYLTFDLSENTYAAVLSDYGLQRGDQLTFCTVQGMSLGNLDFHFVRVILDPTNAAGEPLDLSTPFIVDGAINMPSPRNEGSFATITYSTTTHSVDLRPAIQTMAMGGIIVSRKQTDGNWLRSTASLVISDASTFTGSFSLQYCLDLFEQGGISTPSDRFLNNAGTGRLAGGEASGTSSITLRTGRSWSTGTAIKIVGVDHMTLQEVNIRCLVDENGVKHPLCSDNSYSQSYGGVLINDARPCGCMDDRTATTNLGWGMAGEDKYFTLPIENAVCFTESEEPALSTFMAQLGCSTQCWFNY